VISTRACASSIRSREHDVVNRADACARQHGDRELRHQRHVYRDAIAFLRAKPLEDVRELRNLALEVEVRQRPFVTRFTFPDDGRFIAAAAPHVTVDTVRAGVQLSADEPLCMRRLPIESLRPWPRPFQLAGETRPKRFRIVCSVGIDLLVAYDGAVPKRIRGREVPIFAEEVVELGVLLVGHPEILL
jgi:hypothetical protein